MIRVTNTASMNSLFDLANILNHVPIGNWVGFLIIYVMGHDGISLITIICRCAVTARTPIPVFLSTIPASTTWSR